MWKHSRGLRYDKEIRRKKYTIYVRVPVNPVPEVKDNAE